MPKRGSRGQCGELRPRPTHVGAHLPSCAASGEGSASRLSAPTLAQWGWRSCPSCRNDGGDAEHVRTQGQDFFPLWQAQIQLVHPSKGILSAGETSKHHCALTRRPTLGAEDQRSGDSGVYPVPISLFLHGPESKVCKTLGTPRMGANAALGRQAGGTRGQGSLRVLITSQCPASRQGWQALRCELWVNCCV